MSNEVTTCQRKGTEESCCTSLPQSRLKLATRARITLSKLCEIEDRRAYIPLRGGNSRIVRYGGRSYLNFSSNNYLGLARHPEVVAAWQRGAEICGVGAGSSSCIAGYSDLHADLEEKLASWLGFPRAILFNSGFSANQAVIDTLAGVGDHIIVDRLSHASTIEASVRSAARLSRFVHNDVEDLRRLLLEDCGGSKLVFTEGVFSMDGDLAPVSRISEEVRKFGGYFFLDDAHGVGVLGEQGRGSTSSRSDGGRPDVLIVTFGKAFGVGGAAVLCGAEIERCLRQFSRHLIYSTSIFPAQVLAVGAALDLIIGEGEGLREKLRRNIMLFRGEMDEVESFTLRSDLSSPIQPVITGTDSSALDASGKLRELGLWLTAILPPTVQPGKARLRIILTADHDADDIRMLVDGLRRLQPR